MKESRKRWEDYDTIICPDGEVIDMQKLLVDQQRACAALSHLLPALGGFVSKLRFVYTFRVPTQATDGYNIFINPQFTTHMDLTGKTFVLAHEIMHCLLNHHRRGIDLGHDPMKSNIAADYEVNITLAEDLDLVKVETVKKIGGLIDNKYHHWSYEKIYNDNPPEMNNIQNQGNNQGNNRSAGDSNQDEQNTGKVGPEDCERPDVPETPGSFFDRKTGDKIAEKEGYGKEGGSDAQIEKEWKDNALKVAKNMKNGGKGMGSFARKLESIYKPTKDWKKELRNIVGQSISTDDSRQAYTHKNTLITQGRVARTNKDKYDSMDYMVAMVDTSGSMSEDNIKACLGELYGVALSKKPIKLVLIYFGGGVSKVNVFRNLQEFRSEMKSPNISAGGGTDVGPCFTMLQNDPQLKGKMADLIMIFTDGYLDQVRRNPKTTKNLCWVIIDNPAFDLEYKDARTKCIYIKKEDI